MKSLNRALWPPSLLKLQIVISFIITYGCEGRFPELTIASPIPAPQKLQTDTSSIVPLVLQKTEPTHFSADDCRSAGLSDAHSISSIEHTELEIPSHISVDQPLKTADLYNLKAESFYSKGFPERSIKIWETIVRSNPEHIASLNNLASAYFNQRRYKDAETLYRTIAEVDSKDWQQPDARFLGPMAGFKQTGTVSVADCVMLTEYLNHNQTRYLEHAKKLLTIAIDKVSSIEVTPTEIEPFRAQENQKRKSLVHFWAEWCMPCLKELEELFKFRMLNPDVNYVIVSIDSKYDKTRSDNQINSIFSSFKSPKTENIRFLFDPGKRLWETFIPLADQTVITVPRTLFFLNQEQIRYVATPIDWRNLNPAEVWAKN